MTDIKGNLKAEISTQTAAKQALTRGGGDAYQGFMSALSEEGGEESQDMTEKWSEKYKRSIDCKNPKGFSQRAHCQGKKKKQENKESTGAASAGGYDTPLFGSIKRKIKEELLRKSKEKKSAEKKKEETKEATGASSSGSYVTPAAWAPSTKKKDWRGKSKPLIPGGKFVTVRKKCKKFPYCNQGDIKALKIYENKVVKDVIEKISKEHKINENVIKAIIQYEIENYKNNLNK